MQEHPTATEREGRARELLLLALAEIRAIREELGELREEIRCEETSAV